MNQRFLGMAFFSAIISVSVACSSSKKIDSSPVQAPETFAYRYNGPAVAPKYYRTYTILISTEKVRFFVEDASSRLYSDSSALTPEQYNNFKKAIDGYKLAPSKQKKDENACTGGHAERLTLYKGTPNEVQGWVESCGGQTTADLDGNYMGAIQLFRSMVPDIDAKVAATKN